MNGRAALVALALLMESAWAQHASYSPPASGPVGSSQHVAPDEAQLLSHRHYKTKDGHEVHSPALSSNDKVPVGASAKCLDGTYSFSQHRRGTCSRHGGVGKWL